MSLHKKYLIKKGVDTDKLKINHCKNSIEYYTKAKNCRIVKYIEQDGKFFKIIKNRQGNRFKQKEISSNKFFKKQKNKISNVIEKDFYCVSYNVYYIEYKDFDIKFLYFISKKNERYLSLLKEKYIQYIEKDVTKDAKYSNFYLSMLGKKVESNFNLYKIFRKIDKGKEMKDLLKENIDYKDAVRIKLYMLYINIVQDRFDILDKNNNSSEAINNFKKNIESVIILLEEYKEIFDSGVHEKVLENLTLVYKYTSVYNTIQSLKMNMSELKSCDSDNFYSLIQKYDSEITEKVNIFLMFLETKEYSIIIKQLEILIKELTKNVEIDENITIANSIKKKIYKNYKKSLKTIEKNIHCESEESVVKMINRINRVYTLIRNFKSLYNMNEFYESKRKIANLLNDLNQYRYTFIFESIVLDDLRDKDSQKCIKNMIENKQTLLLKEIKKGVKKYKKAFSK